MPPCSPWAEVLCDLCLFGRCRGDPLAERRGWWRAPLAVGSDGRERGEGPPPRVLGRAAGLGPLRRAPCGAPGEEGRGWGNVCVLSTVSEKKIRVRKRRSGRLGDWAGSEASPVCGPPRQALPRPDRRGKFAPPQEGGLPPSKWKQSLLEGDGEGVPGPAALRSGGKPGPRASTSPEAPPDAVHSAPLPPRPAALAPCFHPSRNTPPVESDSLSLWRGAMGKAPRVYTGAYQES